MIGYIGNGQQASKEKKTHTPVNSESGGNFEGFGEVATGSVRVFRRPNGDVGPAMRREGKIFLRVSPVPAGRCGDWRERKDAHSAVLRDIHDALPLRAHPHIFSALPPSRLCRLASASTSSLSRFTSGSEI